MAHVWGGMQGLASHARTVMQQRFLNPSAEEFWMAACPIIAYWVAALTYDVLDQSSSKWVAKHRVTRKEPGRGNPMSFSTVVLRVIMQQVLQTLVAFVFVLVDPQQCDVTPGAKGWAQAAAQLVIGVFVLDSWQYWIHRWMHVVPFLYRNIHSTHHQLLIPYAAGALYNHPVEAVLLDTVGAGIGMLAAGMSCKLATCFFTFSTIKTVLDHSNYRFPLNPLHDLFPNCAAYHDVHHDLRYIKKNFSQPYLVFWDVLMGTYVDPREVHLTPAQLQSQHTKGHSGLSTHSIAAQKGAAVSDSDQESDTAASAQDVASVAGSVPAGAVAAAQQQEEEVRQGNSAVTAAAAAVEDAAAAEEDAAATPTAIGSTTMQTPGPTTRSRARQARTTSQH